MKRRVLMLALFLVLGAIVNVAVAWGASISNDLLSTTRICEGRTLFDSGWGCYVTRLDGTASTLLWSWYNGEKYSGEFRPYADVAPYWCQFALNDDGIARQWNVQARGWPLRALWCDYDSLSDAEPGQLVGGGIRVGTSGSRSGVSLHALPLRPIWPGFAINTVFYAAVLWMIFAAPFALRKRLRIKRGRCPKCAYPVGTSGKCTECGTTLNNKRQESQ